MALLKPRELSERARQRLETTSADPRRLVLIHTGLIVVMNLVLNGLNVYLNNQIGTTGGLSGLGLRSILETIQTVLGYISMFFTPFWQVGFLFAMISIVRGQHPGTGSLLQGFRRFGRIMSYVFWQMTIVMILCFVLVYLVSFLFVLTPFAADFLELAEPLMMDPNLILPDGSLNMDLIPMEEMAATMIPFFIMYAAVLIPVYAFISYHLRLTNYLLIEGTHRGAMSSMIISIRMMKGHKWQMLKLDLSFWWYYALEAVLLLVIWLDLLLPMLGVELPMDPVAFYFVTLGLYSLLELGLHVWKKPQVDVTYATAYETIYRQFVPETN